jgi:cyanate permease
LAAVFFLVAVAINGTVAHVIPLLTDRGFSQDTATAIFGLFGLATLAGRLLAGYMVDRIFAPHVASVFFLAPIAGFVFLASAAGPLPAVGVVLFGLGLGTEIDLIAFLVSVISDSALLASFTAISLWCSVWARASAGFSAATSST